LDATSIDALYREHGHHVLRRARRILGNEEDAREVVQDVFEALLAHGTSFRGESTITTWLYSSTTNGCLNRLRNAKTRARLLGATPAHEATASPDAEVAAIVRDLLGRVPASLAAIATYYYVDEMTHEEIARVLGCSRRHVGDLLERLHACLRESEKAR
jgi:RNA polymerase sigma-70 factor (ECF subfamily)